MSVENSVETTTAIQLMALRKVAGDNADSTAALAQANIPAPSQDSSVSPHSISWSCRHKVKEPQRKRGPTPLSLRFPQKLFEMVSSHADVITFENSSLVVLDKARLTTEFNYVSFKSFARQLNYYGFVREKNRVDLAYVHPSAVKVEDLVTLVRKDLSTFVHSLEEERDALIEEVSKLRKALAQAEAPRADQPPRTTVSTKWKKGDNVQAKWGNNEYEHYSGKIDAVKASGIYSIAFDDGDYQDSVLEQNIIPEPAVGDHIYIKSDDTEEHMQRATIEEILRGWYKVKIDYKNMSFSRSIRRKQFTYISYDFSVNKKHSTTKKRYRKTKEHQDEGGKPKNGMKSCPGCNKEIYKSYRTCPFCKCNAITTKIYNTKSNKLQKIDNEDDIDDNISIASDSSHYLSIESSKYSFTT